MARNHGKTGVENTMAAPPIEAMPVDQDGSAPCSGLQTVQMDFLNLHPASSTDIRKQDNALPIPTVGSPPGACQSPRTQ